MKFGRGVGFEFSDAVSGRAGYEIRFRLAGEARENWNAGRQLFYVATLPVCHSCYGRRKAEQGSGKDWMFALAPGEAPTAGKLVQGFFLLKE